MNICIMIIIAVLCIALSFIKIYKVDHIQILYMDDNNAVESIGIVYHHGDDEWTNVRRLEKYINEENRISNAKIICMKIDKTSYRIKKGV